MNILEWLKKHGYWYTWNFKIGTRKPDLIAFNDNEIMVFEFKKSITELSHALGQCLSYRKKSNKSFIVLNSGEVERLSSSSLELFKKYGVGLISVNETVKIIVDSNFSRFTDKRLLKKLKDKGIDSTTLSVPKASGEELKQKIIDLLKEHPEGLHILGIAQLVGAHRHTVTKYIHELLGAGVVYQREIGTVKICYLHNKFPKKDGGGRE